MKIEDCEGCIINLVPIKRNCTCKLFNESLTCPCQHCLVKIMCMFECGLFKKFTTEAKEC